MAIVFSAGAASKSADMKIFMKKRNGLWFLVRIFAYSLFDFSNPRPVLAYIDPGFCGYFFSTIFSVIGYLCAATVAFTVFFFRTFIQHFLRSLWSHKKRIIKKVLLVCSLVIGLVCVVTFMLGMESKKEALSSGGIPDRDRGEIADGFVHISGTLYDRDGKKVHTWGHHDMGTIDTNGDYYAQETAEEAGWRRLTWTNEVIWEKELRIHHEIALSPNNTVFCFTKEIHEYKGRKVGFDVILEFDKEGNQLQRFATWDHLHEFQQYHPVVNLDVPFLSIPKNVYPGGIHDWNGDYDYYHLNSLTFVPENPLADKHPAFRPGNWVISFRYGSLLFILDQDTQEILWSCRPTDVSQRYEGQHAPQVLPSGNIIFFDNGLHNGRSSILEIDPLTYEIKWSYSHEGFFSASQGWVQRLENGNTLIADSEAGCVFEVTPRKEIVWKYYKEPQQEELVLNEPPSPEVFYRARKYPKKMIERLQKKYRREPV